MSKDVCDFVNEKSKYTFNLLTDVFKYKLTYSEVGLTDSLIYELTKFIDDNAIRNIEIFKITSDLECLFGNDIDIFVQNSSSNYNWVVLQAKVLGHNGAYNDLIPKKQIPQQWEKLLIHEKIFGSQAYYLLYSGQPKIRTKQVKGQSVKYDCKGNINFDEIGFGIVKADIIRNIRNAKTKYQLLYLKDLFPNEMESLRKIFCSCNFFDENDNIRTYSKAEVMSNLYSKIDKKEFKAEYSKESDNSDYLENLLSYGASKTRIIISNM